MLGDVLGGVGDECVGPFDIIDVAGDGWAGPGDACDGAGAVSYHTSPSYGGVYTSTISALTLPHAPGHNPAKASHV